MGNHQYLWWFTENEWVMYSFLAAPLVIVFRLVLITIRIYNKRSQRSPDPKAPGWFVRLGGWVGNGVPKRFLHECISEHSRDGYEEMVLSTLASVDTVRGGALKYLALVRASTRNVSSLHTIVALAMTGWQRSLLERSSEKSCTCGVWAQAVELISCSSERTGAGLRIRVQRPARLGLGRGRRGGYARLDSVARSQRRRGLRTLLSS
ncbi:Hypothetical protein SMAX5B_021824 [Scophthalmus maximus]|uniref:Uncharacterized protein n=1 Tax=Scophthalmus maximus TaxID=52904 RepID=A0A2U9BHE2_SCOMX|nr:Hypothetical protein SMAX5B_021824 [Scophthalmus maximus]